MDNKLINFHKLACILEEEGMEAESRTVHNMFLKMSKDFKPKYNVEFPMNLDDALNNFDSSTYEVDSEGDWEETDPIEEFRDEIGDTFLHSPSAVDDNHIIFENPKNKHIEVMNMVPKHHLDSLHKNDDR
jgi:hypothetical protein